VRRDRSGRLLGSVPERVGAVEVAAAVAAAGSEGQAARLLHQRVGQYLATIVALSPLTSELTVAYVERVAQPMSAMSLAAGARLVARGYLAQLLVERDGAAFGVAEVPVWGTLPPLNRRGRPPQDLLTRVVKTTRRHFDAICALSPEGWEAFVVATTADVHAEAAVRDDPVVDEGAGFLAAELVDGLLRTGWVLRHVDLAYGLEPELRQDV
jgi:hypothetical protein